MSPVASRNTVPLLTSELQTLLGEFLSANVSSPFLLFMVEGVLQLDVLDISADGVIQVSGSSRMSRNSDIGLEFLVNTANISVGIAMCADACG